MTYHMHKFDPARVDIPRTYGALLVGGFVAATFSGVVTVQACAYSKLFPRDRLALKLLVLLVWVLDSCHTCFVISSLWDHFVTHFGDVRRIDYIPWSLALTVAFTAALTFVVHCFFVRRIHKLSVGNWLITVPLTMLACARLAFACLTTAKMITLRSMTLFVEKYTWSFTLGLSISSLLDILITGFLCYLLLRSQKETSSLNHVLDKLLLYAFESGSLTTAAAVVSLACWISMPTNLIFMALHFVISKFYANSLLATLNRRHSLRKAQCQSWSGMRSPGFPEGTWVPELHKYGPPPSPTFSLKSTRSKNVDKISVEVEQTQTMLSPYEEPQSPAPAYT
ncbi:hypothetical protein BDN72DRAFT_471210 [Pluteus cervinus]|uniref:Uncharacterized protein n=1 Tax=Pluteus cervinus TaxID=181527 RepID=A0ACD3A788_9AGAR|nr:hypothetical protein BDN72DRAFT_471210 [Pluteus cervinus]